MSEVEQYLAPEICAKCFGKCCKRYGGSAKPEDITRNFGDDLPIALRAAFATGLWVIDWWEGDPRGLDYDSSDYIGRGYYIRPRMLGDNDGLYNASWGGQCALLILGEGCSLAPELRPFSCRMIEPKGNGDGECISHGGGKNATAMAWLEHHTLIEEVASEA